VSDPYVVDPVLFLAEEALELFFGFSAPLIPAAFSAALLELEILAEVALFPVTHPFRFWFPALVVGVLIVEMAIQAAVKVGAAMGAEISPHYLPFDLNLFLALMADMHHSSPAFPKM
jgi:hypothetical protein